MCMALLIWQFNVSMLVFTVTDLPAPTLEVQCHRVVNETTGLIGIIARFRIITEEEDENSTTVLDLALEAIDHYEARLDVVELLEGNKTQQVDIVFLHSFTVKVSVSKFVNVHMELVHATYPPAE